MKKTIGVLLVLLLVASLVLVIAGVVQVMRFSNDTADEPDTDLSDENGNEDSDGDSNEAPDDDTQTPGGNEGDDPSGDGNTDGEEDAGTTPEPEPEFGIEAEYTEVLEIVDGESLPEHLIAIAFEESVPADVKNIPVKIYFGTLLTPENAQNAENTVIRIVICDENGGSLLVAQINGTDFYGGKYACSVDPDDSLELKYSRVIEMSVPELLVKNEKGMLTFSITELLVDSESGVELLGERNEKYLYYKKSESGYELSHKKETANIYNYEYLTDISKYLGYIEPTGSLWSNDYLLLVNPWNPIENGEEKTYDAVAPQLKLGDMKDYNFYYQPSLMLNTTAANALVAMFNEAIATGQFEAKHLQVVSAYRSYTWQESIYNRNVSNTKKYVCTNADCGHEYITKNSYTKCELCRSSVKNVEITLEEARKQVSTYSCAPGTSEHQTGLTVDVADTTKSSAILEEPFKDTAAGKWLAENCTKFGFVLRFEKDKEDITGIIYEPWHFRYVGRYHATRMAELDMCLEEYVEYLTEEGYFDDPESAHNPANMEIDPDTYLIVG